MRILPGGSLRPFARACLITVSVSSSAVGSSTLEELAPLANLCGAPDAAFSRPALAMVSPDGKHVYVEDADAYPRFLSAFARNDVTGSLTLVQDDVLEGENLAIRSSAMSPDGKFIYVGGIGPTRGIYVLARDAVTGALTQASATSAPSLEPTAMAISPDGAHVYVGSQFLILDADLWIFARDPVTGALTHLDTIDNIDPGIEMNGAESIVVSPDGDHVYVATSVDPSSSYNPGILIFARDAGTGLLSLVGQHAGSAGMLAISPDGSFLYGGGQILSRDPGTGLLSPAGSTPVNGRLVLDPTGAHAYASRSIPVRGALDVYDRNASTGAFTLTQTIEDDVLAGSFQPAIAPDGAHLYVPAPDAAAVAALARDPLDGTLSLAGAARNPGDPSDPVVSPDGENLYLACNGFSLIADRDPVSGTLANFRQSHTTGALVFRPDGALAWASVRVGGSPLFGGDDTRTLARDVVTGDLTVVGDSTVPTRELRVSPDGQYLYGFVLGVSSDADLGVLAPDPMTGAITQLATFGYGTSLGAVELSPDGAHVYAGRINDPSGAIDVYERDATTGLLTLVASQQGGLGGLPDFRRPVAISFDAGGTRMYVVDEIEAVLVLARDPGTGLLSPVETVKFAALPTPVGTGTGLALHPDGSPLVLRAEGQLVAFRRNPVTGGLFYAQTIAHDVGSAFDRLSGLTWAPDGGDLYASDFTAHSVRIFEPRAACSSAPVVGCSAAPKAAMKVKRDPSGLNSQITAKWNGGTFPPGNPASTTALALCVYDGLGQRMDAFIPPSGTCGIRPCWQASATGFKYRNLGLFPDGVQNVALTAVGGALRKAVIKGKGGHLPDITLPYVAPVVAQLQSSDGACVEASFAVPRRNDGTLFIGKVP
jgi:6-phosphogluconolactonase (cycloisomerase 2 family)